MKFYQKQNGLCPGFFYMPPSQDGALCRVKLPFGLISASQLYQLGHCAYNFGRNIVELTSRANIQLRGISSDRQGEVISQLLQAGLGPLHQKGDNIRNVILSPTAGIDAYAFADMLPMAKKLNKILQYRNDFQKLSPKFSIAIYGGEETENFYHKHDIWVALLNHKRALIGIASAVSIVESKDAENYLLGTIGIELILPTVIKIIRMFLTFQKTAPLYTRPSKFSIDDGSLVAFITQLKAVLPYLELFSAKKIVRHFGRNKHFIHQQKQKNLYYFHAKPPLGRLDFDQIKLFLKLVESIQQARKKPILFRLGLRQNFIIYNCSLKEGYSLIQQLRQWRWGCLPTDSYTRLSCCAGFPFCTKGEKDVQKIAHIFANRMQIKNTSFIHFSGCVKQCGTPAQSDYHFVAQRKQNYLLYQKDSQTIKSIEEDILSSLAWQL